MLKSGSKVRGATTPGAAFCVNTVTKTALSLLHHLRRFPVRLTQSIFCRRWEHCGNSSACWYAGIPRSSSPDANWPTGAIGTLPGALDALAVTMGTVWPGWPGQWHSMAVYPECLASYCDLPNKPSARPHSGMWVLGWWTTTELIPKGFLCIYSRHLFWSD